MAEILHETVGRNYQVPGLPYEDSLRYMRPVLLDDVPSADEVRALLARGDHETLVNPLSIFVVRGFRDYVPTTFKRATAGMEQTLVEGLFGEDATGIPEADRVLLQLQTEVEAKGATLDAALIHDRMNLGTIVNKAHHLNRLYNVGRIYGHLDEREPPFLFGDLTDARGWPEALAAMKQQFHDYLMELPDGPHQYPLRTRTPDVGAQELARDYPFVAWFQEKLGDNFTGALLYGSGARTNDPRRIGDYDNWVRVRDVAAAQQALLATKPALVEGKVVEGVSDADDPRVKSIGIHLFPDDDRHTKRHIQFLHDSIEFRKHTKVLAGDWPFPKVKMDEVVERGISHAYIKLKTIAGSLNWAYRAPERLLGSPPLFEFVVKNQRFFLQHMLNAMGKPEFRDKERLDALLAERGLAIPKYKDDVGHLQTSLVDSMVGVLTLQKEFIQRGRAPRFGFLSHDAAPTGEGLDWGALDD